MKNELEILLYNGAKEIGIDLSDNQIRQFMDYSDTLVEWNKVMNLTAITEPIEIITKHFLDSLSVVTFMLEKKVPPNARVVDVGTGAGFPGIPMKIVRPDINLILLDSLAKRINFLNEVTLKLGITDVLTIHSRAEDGARKPELRDSFDMAVSRAVADLSVLSEYCLPYVKLGGVFIAMKGADCLEEIRAAQKPISILSGEIIELRDYKIPASEITHKLIMIKKLRQTSPKYPRNSAQISKTPIK